MHVQFLKWQLRSWLIMDKNNLNFQLEVLSDSDISAVARARVSEGSEDEIRNSIQSQKDAIKELALRLEVGKVYWFIELEAVSAFKRGGDTELFKQAREFACSNKDVKYFLQWDQTRFCRDRNSSQIFKRQLLKHGVDVRFCHGDIADKTTGSSVILEAVQEALAEADGIEKGQHVLRGCLTNAKNRDETTGWCFKNGGSPPYGYKRLRIDCGKKKNGDPLLKTAWVENDEVIACTIDGKQVSKTVAAWTQYILIELRLNKGLGFDRIRDHLNEIGLPAPRKQYWSDTTICEMTRNIAYCGVSIYNKHNWSSYRRGMGLKIKDTKELIIEESSQPALITKEQFKMLQNMSKPANKSVRSQRKQLSDSPYLLTVGFSCKSCGGQVIGRTQRYVCSTYDRKGKKACGAPLYTIKQSWIEEEVIKRIGLSFDETIINGVIDVILKSYNPPNRFNEAEALKKKIEEDKKAKENLLNILQTVNSGKTSVDIILARIEELNKSIESCQAELSKSTRLYLVPSKETLKAKITGLIDVFEKSNHEKRRQILKMFIKQIVLDPFNKCVVVEGYCNPLCTWTEDIKTNKKASDYSEASDLGYVEHGCGGRI